MHLNVFFCVLPLVVIQMLDMHRASSKQFKVNMTPTDLLHDVIEPVGGLLHQRDNSKMKVKVSCPKGLFILTDRLRLKQVSLFRKFHHGCCAS